MAYHETNQLVRCLRERAASACFEHTNNGSLFGTTGREDKWNLRGKTRIECALLEQPKKIDIFVDTTAAFYAYNATSKERTTYVNHKTKTK